MRRTPTEAESSAGGLCLTVGLLLLVGFIYNIHELYAKPPAQGLLWALFETAVMGALGIALAYTGSALGGSDNPDKRRWALAVASRVIVVYAAVILTKWGLVIAGLIQGKSVSVLGLLIVVFIWHSLAKARRATVGHGSDQEVRGLSSGSPNATGHTTGENIESILLLRQKRQELIPVVRRWVLTSWVAILFVCPLAVWQPLAGLALSVVVPAIMSLLLRRVGGAAQSRTAITLSNVYPVAAVAVLAVPLLLGDWFMDVLFDSSSVPPLAGAILPGLVAAATCPFAFRAWVHPIDDTDPFVCRQCGYLLYGLTDPRCPECGTSFEVQSGMPRR